MKTYVILICFLFSLNVFSFDMTDSFVIYDIEKDNFNIYGKIKNIINYDILNTTLILYFGYKGNIVEKRTIQIGSVSPNSFTDFIVRNISSEIDSVLSFKVDGVLYNSKAFSGSKKEKAPTFLIKMYIKVHPYIRIKKDGKNKSIVYYKLSNNTSMYYDFYDLEIEFDLYDKNFKFYKSVTMKKKQLFGIYTRAKSNGGRMSGLRKKVYSEYSFIENIDLSYVKLKEIRCNFKDWE